MKVYHLHCIDYRIPCSLRVESGCGKEALDWLTLSIETKPGNSMSCHADRLLCVAVVKLPKKKNPCPWFNKSVV